MSLSAIVMPIAARSLPREHPTCHTIPVSLQSELRLGWPFAAVPAIIGRLDDHSFGGERRAELEPNYFANGATKPLIHLGALQEHRPPALRPPAPPIPPPPHTRTPRPRVRGGPAQ